MTNGNNSRRKGCCCSAAINKACRGYRFFRAWIISSGQGAEKTAFPATRTSAPAFTRRAPVSKLTPPSTSINAFEPVCVMSSYSSHTFSTVLCMNFWPPNPGLTPMRSTISTSRTMSFSNMTGVAGLIVTAGFIPASRICCTTRCR